MSPEHGLMLPRLASVSEKQLHLWLMLVLTFTTGINDAVGYLGFDKVFTGNMTGNVVVLGIALAGDSGLPVLGPALAMVGFLVGAALAGRVLRRATRPWPPQTTVLLAGVALTMLVLGLAAGAADSSALTIAVTTTAAVAMGAQAATARHLAVTDVTTVVVTSTMTGLAADSWLGNGKRHGTSRRVAAIGMLLGGALCGGLLLHLSPSAGLLVAGAIIAFVTLVGAAHASPASTRGGRFTEGALESSHADDQDRRRHDGVDDLDVSGAAR